MDDYKFIDEIRSTHAQMERDEKRYFWIMLGAMLACFVVGIIVGQKVGL